MLLNHLNTIGEMIDTFSDEVMLVMIYAMQLYMCERCKCSSIIVIAMLSSTSESALIETCNLKHLVNALAPHFCLLTAYRDQISFSLDKKIVQYIP